MLQIDASNAFNNMKREFIPTQRSIHLSKNPLDRWFLPSKAMDIQSYLMNTYQKAARLFIGRGTELESQESTTQGDNIAMA